MLRGTRKYGEGKERKEKERLSLDVMNVKVREGRGTDHQLHHCKLHVGYGGGSLEEGMGAGG